MPPPSEITVEKPMRSGAAKSSSAVATAPDCATSARRPGSAVGAQNVALRPMSVRMTPNAPGPTRRIVAPPRDGATSRVHASAAAAVDGGGERHDDRRLQVAGRQRRSRTSATAAGGVAMTASSTGAPIAGERAVRDGAPSTVA